MFFSPKQGLARNAKDDVKTLKNPFLDRQRISAITVVCYLKKISFFYILKGTVPQDFLAAFHKLNPS